MIIVKKISCALLPEILTQPVAPPRGHHRNGQERCPRDWKNVIMPQILLGACSLCDSIVDLLDYLIGVVAYILF